MAGVWTAHHNRTCHVCGCQMTRKRKDALGVGVVRPWRGFKPVGSHVRAEKAFVCEGCLQGAARWLSCLPDRVALTMLHSARRGKT